MRCALAASLLAAALAAGAQGPADAPASSPWVVGPFSQGTAGGPLPEGWVPLTFPRIPAHTTYALVRDADGTVVLAARAEASASGLVRKLDRHAEARPLLSWRWKADRVIARGDVTRKDGDDYPVRIYVSFRYSPERLTFAERVRYTAARVFYGEYPPHAGINYIWDAKAPVGTVVPNPFTDRVRMIVVESGSANLDTWREYRRDIVADYRRAFGEDPPPISGIAVMTDADNTGESVSAWYGDIALSARAAGVQGSVTPSVQSSALAPSRTTSEQ